MTILRRKKAEAAPKKTRAPKREFEVVSVNGGVDFVKDGETVKRFRGEPSEVAAAVKRENTPPVEGSVESDLGIQE
jgi:hypothetical protein